MPTTPTNNAFSVWTSADISQVTQCPQNNIETVWPLVFSALQAVNQGSIRSCAGAIGTIAIETASKFVPVSELYNDPPGKYAYFEQMYGPNGSNIYAKQMGNTEVGDGAKYYGRGLIQLTWKNNYISYGNLVGADLLNNPDLLLQPDISAKVFAQYWVSRNIQEQADREDWTSVRASVQGGSAGLSRLIQIANDLLNMARQKNML